MWRSKIHDLYTKIISKFYYFFYLFFGHSSLRCSDTQDRKLMTYDEAIEVFRIDRIKEREINTEINPII